MPFKNDSNVLMDYPLGENLMSCFCYALYHPLLEVLGGEMIFQSDLEQAPQQLQFFSEIIDSMNLAAKVLDIGKL